MDQLDFSEKEIRQQLAVLGYRNIPKHKLLEFKKGLEEVIHGGSWTSPTSSAQINHSEKTRSSPPAFTKEKVSKEFFRRSEGFFLHEGRAENNRQLLSTHTIGGSGSQHDSYAQNSVAPKLHFPMAGPVRLQVEPGEDADVKDSSDSDSLSSDSRQRRFLKRKVLRKHGGQSLVCDESVYSEDSGLVHRMWDEGSDEDRSSLCSSFWSDGEQQEEEIERTSAPDPNTSDELKNRRSFKPETHDDDDEVSRSDSAAVSLMTSGYGTWRPEEEDRGEHREERSSRGDLSQTRDEDEEQRSLIGFEELRVRDDLDLNGTLVCLVEEEEEKRERERTPWEELHRDAQKHQLPNNEERLEDEEQLEDKDCLLFEKRFQNKAHQEDEERLLSEIGLEDEERLEDVVGLVGRRTSASTKKSREAEDPDESRSHKDVKFIDSQLGSCWTPGAPSWAEQQANASCLEERLADLHFPAAADGRDLEAESDDWSPSPHSEETDSVSSSAFESYLRTMTRAQSEGDLRPKPKSFIRPVRSQPTVKKSDPVAKYFQYKQIWEMFKLPGENDRKALRWEIRERLAHQAPPPKPRRVLEPNSYVVPTEKKRSALRWEVRNRLANSLQL